MIAAVDVGLSMADDNTKVIPGHGPVSTKADMKAYRDALEAFLSRIAGEHKAGKSLDDLLAMKLEWQAASGPVPADRLVRAAYQEIAAAKN